MKERVVLILKYFHLSSPRPPHPPLWASDGRKSRPHFITVLNVSPHHGIGNASTVSSNLTRPADCVKR